MQWARFLSNFLDIFHILMTLLLHFSPNSSYYIVMIHDSSKDKFQNSLTIHNTTKFPKEITLPPLDQHAHFE